MKRIFVAIPCMETVNTEFFQSILGLKFGDLGAPRYGVSRSSLVYDARNSLAKVALDAGAERIMWLDSDMTFEPDVIQRLSADLDEGRDFVTGLCFKRKSPVLPVIYKETGYTQSEDLDKVTPFATIYEDYPKDSIFEVAGAGFACTMISADLMREVYDVYGAPFAPQPGFGEDLSLCRRLEEMGVKMYCDSRIKVGHVASTIVDEAFYLDGRQL